MSARSVVTSHRSTTPQGRLRVDARAVVLAIGVRERLRSIRELPWRLAKPPDRDRGVDQPADQYARADVAAGGDPLTGAEDAHPAGGRIQDTVVDLVPAGHLPDAVCRAV